MKKRVLCFMLCILMTLTVFPSTVYAGSLTEPSLMKTVQAAKVKTITPKVTLSYKSAVWSGKAKTPKVTVKYGSTVLKKGRDYTVSYKNNVSVGKATVTVTLKGKYSGRKTVSFKILPKGTGISSLSKSSGTLTVKWTKQTAKMSKSRITGYQIQTATNKDFTKNKKTVKVEGYKKTSAVIKNLKSNTKYYVRIRTYKTIGEKTYYSKWSKVKYKKDAEPLPGLTVGLGKNDALLLDALAESEENAIISPMSVNMVLAMLLEGAGGDTKTELETYLGVKKEKLGSYAQSLFSSAADKERLKVLISNAFWYREDQEVEEDYLSVLADRYGAEIAAMDFADPMAAANIINAWCKEKTRDLIPSIVNPGDLADASDVLLNTLYFNGKWQIPVEDYCIKDGIFHGFKKNMDVKFLYSEETKAYENEKAIAFEKPYYDNYSFIGILPKKEGDFSVSDLDIPGLMQKRVSGYDVIRAVMPKFDLESGGDITEILQALGIQKAFEFQIADFSGIAQDVYISKVIHKTKMILDENGTEAAAATAAVLKDSAAPFEQKVLEIKLDRPYAFMIVDRQSGNVLFIGKITNPAK